jgi:hypothetical protein
MRTVNWNPVLSGVCAFLGGAFLSVTSAAAHVTVDNAAGLIVWPKLVFDSDEGLDTVIQLSNTSPDQINVRCFYVNANSHCLNAPELVCNINQDCGPGGICLEGWVETDFSFTLTGNQPIQWRLSEGLPFFPLDGFIFVGPNGQSNGPLSSIPPAPEDPFKGELKCVEVGEDESPVDRNDLKGEATIVLAEDEDDPEPDDVVLDARGYNALGIQAIPEANDGDNTLCLGGEVSEICPNGAEYNGCPNILIMDHFFDDAFVFGEDGEFGANSAYVRSHLTVVPCSQDFFLQDAALFNTVIQFLIFNEFEQRFSTSRSVKCFKEFELSSIDTREDRGLEDEDPTSNNNLRSIFNVNVQGTLTGHTRMRPVDDGSPIHGNGLIGIVEEFHRPLVETLDSLRGSAAFQLHHVGARVDNDVIRLP